MSALPGMVASIQTFGSYANFHPHIHALVTNGVVTPEGEWLALGEWTPGVIEEVFCRLVVRGLVRAERLSEEFRDVLLPWERSGFSVYGEQVIVEETEAGKVRVETPLDPRMGARGLELDPVEWIHALGRQVPDPRQHLVRYYGLYANRSRSGSEDPFVARERAREGGAVRGCRTGRPATAGFQERLQARPRSRNAGRKTGTPPAWVRYKPLGVQSPTHLAYHTSWTRLLFRFLFDRNVSLYSRIVREERGGRALNDPVGI